MNIKSTLLVTLLLCFTACAQQKESTVKASDQKDIAISHQVVIPELDIPWGMAFLPDGSILVTEKTGSLIHFNKGVKTVISGLPDIYVRGQGGLMDVVLHPDFAANNLVYLSHASSAGEAGGGNTAIIRAKLKDGQLTNVEVLYKAVPNTSKGQHFGSRLAFDDQGFLYFSIGDRGNRDENPQDITRDGGKIYRIHDDGRIPADNPFVNTKGAKTAIYSYGHRNPQGMVKHPETGQIWTNEHGPKGGDEINIISAGKNFGWPVISYGINYSGTTFTEITEKEGMEQPLFYWVPSIAPSGMAIVSSDVYKGWKGSVLVGSLKFQYLERLVLENGKVSKREKILEGLGRVRDVRQGPDGYIYVAIEGLGIVKVIPEN